MTSKPHLIYVTELTNPEQWHAIAGCWDDLLARTPEASVFNSFAFLHSYCKKFLILGKCRLAILILKDSNGKIIGAAPMARIKRWVAGFPVRVISLIYDRDVMDRPQFLFPDRRKEQLRAIFQFFQNRRNEWDVIELKEQVLDPEYEEVFHEVFKNTREYNREVITLSIDPFLRLDSNDPDSWENYLITRSKKHRKKWRYLHNRLAQEGTISITRHTGDENLLPIMAEYQALEQKSRKKSWPAEKLKKIHNFYLEIAQVLRPKGNVHFVFLRMNGIPIAGLIGMSFNGRYVALQTAFDEDFSKYSPGFLVGGYDVKWVMENGFSEYDFMSGFLTDKLLWTDSYRSTCFLRIVRKRAWAGLFYLTKFRIAPAIISMLDKTGLDSRLGDLLGYEKPVRVKSKFTKHNNMIQCVNPKPEQIKNTVQPISGKGDDGCPKWY